MFSRKLIYPVVSRLLALVLMTAGLLKGYDLLLGVPEEQGFWDDRALAVSIAGLEIVFSLWLLVGLFPRPTRWLTVVCFGSFLCFAVASAMAGETSCGCFGSLAVNPWYTAAFDLIAVIALVVGGSETLSVPTRHSIGFRFTAFTSLVFVVGGAVLWAAHHFAPVSLDEEGEIAEGANVLALDPVKWTGRQLPLMRHIDIGGQLRQGRWIVVLYRRGCPACWDAVARYVGFAHELSSQSSGTRVALVEVPVGGITSPRGTATSACARGTLSPDKHWQIHTPLFFLLKNGMVEVVSEAASVLLRESASQNETASQQTDTIIFPNYRQIRRELFLREIACGPLALIAILQNQGVRVSAEEMDKLLAEAGSNGIDLLRLKELAEGYGLNALGVEVSTAKLRQMGQPAIVYLNSVGFSAVTGFKPEGVEIVYPLRPKGILPDDIFERSFGKEGYALLISSSPLSPERLGLHSPDSANAGAPKSPLRLSRIVLSVGRIHRSHWEASVTLTNEGTEPIVIEEVKASCPCMSATIDQKELTPGQSANLRAKGVQDRLGGFTYFVQVRTNQKGMPVLRVPVRGYLEQPVGFDRPAMTVPHLGVGEASTIEVALDIATGFPIDSLRVQTPAGAPLTAEVRHSSEGQPVLAIHWRGTAPPGSYHFPIDILAGSETDAIPSRLLFAADVVPDVEPIPASLLIRNEELQSGWSRKIRCKLWRPCKEPLLISWSDPAFTEAIHIEQENQSQDGFCIVLSCKANLSSGLAKKGRAELSLQPPEGHPSKVMVFIGDAQFMQAGSGNGLGEGAKKESRTGK